VQLVGRSPELAAIPALLGLTGLVVFFLLRRAQGSDHITLHIIERIRRNAPDIFADHVSGMKPAALSKAIEANVQLRTQVGEHDFQLLREALRNQFIISLVVYGLCVFCIFVGAFLFLFMRPPPSIAQQVIFRSGGAQVAATGVVAAHWGTEKRSESFKGATYAVIGGIPPSELGNPFTLTITSDDYELEDGLRVPQTFSKSPIFVSLKLKDSLPYAGSIFVGDRPASGAKVELLGLPCETTTEASGYFAFNSCPQARRLDAAKLLLTLASTSSACLNPFPLLAPPKLTAIKVNADCSRFEFGVMACAACKPQFEGENNLCEAAVIGELWNRLPPNSQIRLEPQLEIGARNCATTCHVTVASGFAHVRPKGFRFPAPAVRFPAPAVCSDREFTVDAVTFLARGFNSTVSGPPKDNKENDPR
jgi:hypothetical protein